MENKKKKLAALVEISKLNEHDRILKLSRTTDAVSGKMGIIETEPIPKRPRTSSESEGTVSAKVRYVCDSPFCMYSDKIMED